MGSSASGDIVRTFPARSSALAEVRRFVVRLANQASLSHRVDWLVLAVTEACTNAMVHTSSEQISVTWRAYPDRIEVEVADEGVFRRSIAAQEVEGEAHRGFPIMLAATDQVHIVRGTADRPGTVVRLVVRRPASRPGKDAGEGSVAPG